MKWFLSLFAEYRRMEDQLAEYALRVERAEVQAAWAQRKLDDMTASEREAWREAVKASQMGGDLAAQYAFGRSMFGVGPEVAKRSNDVKHVAGPRTIAEIKYRAQHEILADVEQAEAYLMGDKSA